MGFMVMKIEGKDGADDQIKVVSGTTETIFDDAESAASFVKVDTDWLEEHLDNADYDEGLDIDALEAEEEEGNEEEEESGKGA